MSTYLPSNFPIFKKKNFFEFSSFLKMSVFLRRSHYGQYMGGFPMIFLKNQKLFVGF